MVKLVNKGNRIFGEYGEEGYADVVTEEVYEEHRFQSNRSGRVKARHEMAIVKNYLDSLPAEQKILDVPCGMGRFTDAITEAGHQAVGVDINKGMLSRAKSRHGDKAQFIKGDVMHLPFPDQAFDAIICFRLLHHLPDNMILETLKELRRMANTALVTFYSTHCVKYQRKHLLGKKISGQYYAPSHMQTLCNEAGWQDSKHLNPFDFHRNLHALRLS